VDGAELLEEALAAGLGSSDDEVRGEEGQFTTILRPTGSMQQVSG
jgi:hypothetical protein